MQLEAHFGCGVQPWESSRRSPKDTNTIGEVNSKIKKPRRGGATHNVHQGEEVVLDVLFAMEADHGVVHPQQHLDVVIVLSRVSAVPCCFLQLLVNAAGNSTYIVKASQIRLYWETKGTQAFQLPQRAFWQLFTKKESSRGSNIIIHSHWDAAFQFILQILYICFWSDGIPTKST